MTQSRRFALHGLVLETPFRLDASETDSAPDFEVLEGVPRSTGAPPPGTLLAEFHIGATDFWLTGDPDAERSWILRYRDVIDFSIDFPARRIMVHRDPRSPIDLTSVLLAGSVVAHLLAARGHPTLHANAVEWAGGAVAVVGPSGRGKSTTSALLCRAGARLVSDDVVRVVSNRSLPQCCRGSTVIRLRPGLEELATDGPNTSSAAASTDGRLRFSPPVTARKHLPLAALVFPRPDRGSTELTVDRLDPPESIPELLASPRLIGWKLPGPLREHFDLAAALSGATPSYRVGIPWGPPFAGDLGAAILRAVTN